MYLMLMIGNLGQYHADIPGFHGVPRIPGQVSDNGWPAAALDSVPQYLVRAAMVIIVPSIVAYLFGWLAFRSRIKGVYFSILSQALTYARA